MAREDGYENTISAALEDAKAGHKFARHGWNLKGMHVYAQFPDEHSKMTHPYLVIVVPGCKEGERHLPWQPSQVDLFATDYYLV